MKFLALILIAIVVEGVVEWVQTIYQSGKFSWPRLFALIVGITVCIAAETDLFLLLGIPLAWPFVGAVLTGILVSRGSNYIHDFVSKLTTTSTKE